MKSNYTTSKQRKHTQLIAEGQRAANQPASAVPVSDELLLDSSSDEDDQQYAVFANNAVSANDLYSMVQNAITWKEHR